MRRIVVAGVLCFFAGVLHSDCGLSKNSVLARLTARTRYHLQDLKLKGSDILWRTGIENLFVERDWWKPKISQFYRRDKGRYFITSETDYYTRSYRRGKERHYMHDADLEEARKVLGELSLVGYGKFSMTQESLSLDAYRSYHRHNVFVAKAGVSVSLAVIDGFKGDTYMGGFASEKVVGMLRASLQREPLQESLLGIPQKLDWAINRQVRGNKDRASLDDYHPDRPIPENAGVFVVGAEITEKVPCRFPISAMGGCW